MNIVDEWAGYLLEGYSPIEIPNRDRRDLARLFCMMGAKHGVEVGVQRGEFAEVLCQENPTAAVWGVDPWSAYARYHEHVTQDEADALYAETLERMRPYHWRAIRQPSLVASREFGDGMLDFVYLDGAHDLLNVVQDLHVWMPKLKPGGVMAGHDFARRKTSVYQVHVVEAVTAYTAAYHVSPWFVVGRSARVVGEVRDEPRSWFWLKEA